MTITELFSTTRQAAVVSRRASLRVLGGAAVAGALGAPAAASAGYAGKKARRRCQKQRGPCIAAIEDTCASTIDPAVCEASLGPCCAHFARCNVRTGILCLFKVE